MGKVAIREKRTCQTCHEEFLILPCYIRKGGGKYCSRKCWLERSSAKTCPQCGRSFRTRAKLQKFCSTECYKAYLYHPIEARCLVCGCKIVTTKRYLSKMCSKECRSIYAKRYHHTTEAIQKISVTGKGRHQPLTAKRKLSALMKLNWQNPDFVGNRVRAMNVKPTQPEVKLIDICAKYLPDFKYNGDYRLGVTLSGLIPDFINCNGEKEVLEVFGDYIHSPEKTKGRWNRTELGRIMAYNSLGYKCLVLWEHELNQLSEREIVTKIHSFFRGK